MASPVKVGIIGCGTISGAYFKGCAPYDIVEIKSCADLDMNRAKEKAEEFGVEACSIDALLADPEIQIVVNLTIPKAHAEVNLAGIAAGKSVHCEKPLAVNRADVVKSDFLEQGGWTHHSFDVFFRFLRKLSQWRQRLEEPPCRIATPCVGF